MILLTPLDLALGALLILLLALATLSLRLEMGSRLLLGALRATLQLGLLGYIVQFIFSRQGILWVLAISLVMLLAAAKEVTARQKRSFVGFWGFGLSLGALTISSYLISFYALWFILQAKPWFEPQYSIPMLGILLGNTMNGVSLGLDRLTSLAYERQTEIEGRLSLGQNSKEAILGISQEAFRTGLTPIINTMAAAGLVSLPGLMTGQILAGGNPLEAAKYQILVIFLIVAGTGLGTLASLWLAANRLFDNRMRLRLDRLQTSQSNVDSQSPKR